MDTLLGEVTIKITLLPFLKGVYFKRKDFVPFWSKFFPFKVDPLSEKNWCTGKQAGSYNCYFPYKNGTQSTMYSVPLTLYVEGKSADEK